MSEIVWCALGAHVLGSFQSLGPSTVHAMNVSPSGGAIAHVDVM